MGAGASHRWWCCRRVSFRVAAGRLVPGKPDWLGAPTRVGAKPFGPTLDVRRPPPYLRLVAVVVGAIIAGGAAAFFIAAEDNDSTATTVTTIQTIQTQATGVGTATTGTGPSVPQRTITAPRTTDP
jgi:hypothetical protein